MIAWGGAGTDARVVGHAGHADIQVKAGAPVAAEHLLGGARALAAGRKAHAAEAQQLLDRVVAMLWRLTHPKRE